MTYDEAIKKWFLRKYGNKEVTYYVGGRLSSSRPETYKSKIVDIINLNEKIELDFHYEEGYQYSEYTGADTTFSFDVRFSIREDTAYFKYQQSKLLTVNLFDKYSLDDQEVVSIGDIIKEVLEISQE